MRRSAYLLALVACAGCQDLPSVVWSGKRIDFAADAGDVATLCEGTLPFADAKAEAIGRRLGTDARVTFYWLPQWAAHTPCPPVRSIGCAADGEAFSAEPISDHEVVHVLAGRVGEPDPFLSEGLAEYLGGSRTQNAIGDPTEFYGLGRPELDPSFYPTAGRFVGRIVEWSSMADLQALYRRSNWGDDPARFEALLRQNTGIEAGDVADSFATEPSCGSIAYREDPIGCKATAAPLLDVRHGPDLVVEAEMDCGSADVVGQQDAMEWHGTIEVGEARRTSAVVSADTQALLIPCAPGCAAGDAALVSDPETPQWLWLDAGVYQVILSRTSPGTAQLTFD